MSKNKKSLYVGDKKIADIKCPIEPITEKDSPEWTRRDAEIDEHIRKQLREQIEAQLDAMVSDIKNQMTNDSERSEE
jgi:hypothetical protein